MDSSINEREVLVAITIGIAVMLLLAIAFGLFFYFSQKKFQAQRMEAHQRELEYKEQLLFRTMQAQENERQRIARVMHDEVGSKLNIINLGLHRLQKYIEAQPDVGGTIKELIGVIGHTIDTTRQISHELLPPTLESFGLQAALEELCENSELASGVKVHFELCENCRNLGDNAVELGFFRAVQELMTNSFKHAKASQINVKLWCGTGEVRLTYQDNGTGFDPNTLSNRTGLGLRNIESRMRMIGAAYQLESAVGKGVFVQMKKQFT